MTETLAKTVDAAVARRNLVEVLEFLDRRGASPEAIRMAMMRAGIQPDVSRLLAQCLAPGPLEAAAKLPTPAVPVAEPHPETAFKALHWFANTFVLWGVLLAGGFMLGFAVGAEMGVAYGVEQGLDRLQQTLQNIGEVNP